VSREPSWDADGGSKDVIVIGAGIVGACCAAYLAREGHRVVLLEAEEPGAGASRGNAGALSPGSCVPLATPGMLRKVPSWLRSDGPLVVRPSYLPWALPWLARFIAAGRAKRVGAIADALRALHAPVHESYRPLLKDAGASDLVRRSGSVVVYRTAAAFDAAAAEWEMRRRRGAEFTVLEGPELRERVPALSADFERAVLQPDHGFVAAPKALVEALVNSVLARGGRLLRGKAVAIGDRAGGIRVDIEGGEPVFGDRAVIAAGAWSKPLLHGLGIWAPLETQRGYHLHLPDPGIDLPVPVSFAEAKFYATPMRDGLRLAGTVEFAGLAAPPDPQRARRLAGLARRWLPNLQTANASEWMGHRPCLPDSLPAIGPVPGRPNVLAAFGHGHNGMTSAPSTGRLIADMVAGRKPFIDPHPYRPERFR
jgi:D-amino-acid dehydrogenase